jgi:hypothetical protein
VGKPYITTIGLWGNSMGAVTALLAACDDLSILVCDSPFSNLGALCRVNYYTFILDLGICECIIKTT